MDYLLVSLSVLGAGLAFGTKAPLEREKGERTWLLAGLRLLFIAAMIIPGAMVSDLFGPTDSTTSYWRTAVALWLPGLILALIFRWPGDDRPGRAGSG
ncbi:MAG: hypothetical protein NTX33_12035 [Propionibacteriales bacterium]|nr:hypothetical protein [Propionibacteriales bacterium]